MARLIDADELEKVMTEDWFLDILLTQTYKNDMAKKLVNMIDSVPLAYDVEKVVEELSREFKPILTEKKGFLGISQLVVVGYEINTSKAIEIVRKGGVE